MVTNNSHAEDNSNSCDKGANLRWLPQTLRRKAPGDKGTLPRADTLQKLLDDEICKGSTALASCAFANFPKAFLRSAKAAADCLNVYENTGTSAAMLFCLQHQTVWRMHEGNIIEKLYPDILRNLFQANINLMTRLLQ